MAVRRSFAGRALRPARSRVSSVHRRARGGGLKFHRHIGITVGVRRVIWFYHDVLALKFANLSCSLVVRRRELSRGSGAGAARPGEPAGGRRPRLEYGSPARRPKAGRIERPRRVARRIVVENIKAVRPELGAKGIEFTARSSRRPGRARQPVGLEVPTVPARLMQIAYYLGERRRSAAFASQS
jgi:hypothetical protein